MFFILPSLLALMGCLALSQVIVQYRYYTYDSERVMGALTGLLLLLGAARLIVLEGRV